MRSSPLFCNVRHRAMKTPVSPLRTRLTHISPSYWNIYCLFEVILEGGLFTGLEFKLNILSM